MKIACLMLWCFLALGVSAQTNQGWKVCRNPVRVFPGKANVDLTPLYQWWVRQPLVVTNEPATNDMVSDRPLTGWQRVAGTKVATTGASWVVDATIYTSPTVYTNARILLNNPPVMEEQRFNALKAESASAEERWLDLRRVYDQHTNEEARAQALVDVYRHSLSKVASDGVAVWTRVAVQKHDAAAVTLNQMDRLAAEQRQVDAQWQSIPNYHGTYQVDWFAVLRGRSKQGVLIYDLGLVSATPP